MEETLAIVEVGFDIFRSLKKLKFIKYVRHGTDKYRGEDMFEIRASSKMNMLVPEYLRRVGKQIKEPNPITIPGHETATGILVMVFADELYFYEITSKIKGAGEKMVLACLSNVPEGTKVGMHHDWSDGFWQHMKEKYPNYHWMI